jgi:hypothetical protein
MTFYATIGGSGEHANLVLALRIEGVPVALVERAIPAASAPALSGYTQFVGVTRVEEGEAVLDIDERRETAATLEIDLLDDAARTLAALFAVNTRRYTWLKADAAVGATTLSPSNGSSGDNGRTLYFDDETITLGTFGGSSFTGCTRGAFGSTAAARYGTTSDGDSVYTVPPSWVGRRAYLYGYALDANGGAEEQLLGLWIIDAPPRHKGDDAWCLSLASVAQEFYERRIGVGLETVDITSGGWSAEVWNYVVSDATRFRAASSFPTYAMIEDREAGGRVYHSIKEVSSVNTGTGTVSIVDRALFGTVTTSVFPKSIRQIQFVGGIRAPLYLLLSNEGQGAATYDRLPGRLPASQNDYGWRFGAAFKTSEVDVASWEAQPYTAPCTFIIDREQRLSDVLREWCLLNGAATRVTADGKLSVFTLATPRVAASTSIGPNSVIPDGRVEVFADESAITPILTVRTGWSPIYDDFAYESHLLDAAMARRYGRMTPRERELEFKCIACTEAISLNPGGDDYRSPFSHPSAISAGEIGMMAVDLQRGDSGLARRFLRLSLTMAHLDLRIGDVVTLSGLPNAFSTLPDMVGGTLEGARCRVVARRPRYDAGRIDVQLLVLDPLLVVSPAAVISAAAGAVLTLDTTGIEVSGASPAADFYAGAGVRVYDISGATSHATTVASVNTGANQITLTAAPGFAVQTGVDYVVLNPVGSTSAGTTSSGYALQEFAALANLTGAVTGAVAGMNSTPRWR